MERNQALHGPRPLLRTEWTTEDVVRTRDGRRFGEVDIMFSALRPLLPGLTGDDA